MIPTRDLFTRHRLRCTRQRMALYDALCQCKSHPTAEDLFKLVAPHLGGMSRATVYNTLEALVSAGLARRMPTPTGCNRYDADISNHLHVSIADTAEIRDVPPDLGEQLTRSLPQPILDEIERCMGVRINGVDIQFTATARPASGG